MALGYVQAQESDHDPKFTGCPSPLNACPHFSKMYPRGLEGLGGCAMGSHVQGGLQGLAVSSHGCKSSTHNKCSARSPPREAKDLCTFCSHLPLPWTLPEPGAGLPSLQGWGRRSRTQEREGLGKHTKDEGRGVSPDGMWLPEGRPCPAARLGPA